MKEHWSELMSRAADRAASGKGASAEKENNREEQIRWTLTRD